MLLVGKKVGFALTGSFCTFEKTIEQISKLMQEGAEIIPIMSFNGYNVDTRFGNSKYFIEKIESITGKRIIHTIEEAEPIGSKKMTDIMVVAPCSRKYNRENGKWNNKYSSACSCKITSKKRKTIGIRNSYK